MRVIATPHPEVDVLCRLALADYLSGQVPDLSRAALDVLLGPDSQFIPEEPTALGGTLEMWRRLDGALDTITVLDPSCGEGHFLVGMARVLSEVRNRIAPVLPPSRPEPDLCRIVERNLFGIDVQREPLALAGRHLRGLGGGTAQPNLLHDDSLLLEESIVHSGAFPAVRGSEGFDLIIGNPPYVRHESIADPQGVLTNGDYKRRLVRGLYRAWPHLFDWDDAAGRAGLPIDRRSDLALFFLFMGLRLLQPRGILAYVVPTALFQARYGQVLTQSLRAVGRSTTRIEMVRRRSFVDARVNTSLFIVGAQEDHPTGGRIHEYRVQSHPEFAAIRKEMRRTEQVRAPLPGEEAQAPTRLGTAGGRGLSQVTATYPVVSLDRIGTVRYALKTGLNRFFYIRPATVARFGIEAEFCRPAVKSPREVTHLSLDPASLPSLLFVCRSSLEDLEREGKPGALAYITWGSGEMAADSQAGVLPSERPSFRNRHPWYALPIPRPADFLCLRFFDRRFFFAAPREAVVEDQTFYGLCLHETYADRKTAVAAALNSSLTYLQLEAGGRTGLGDGVRQYALCDMAALTVPDPSRLSQESESELAAVYSSLAARPVLPVQQEMQQADRHALDAIVGAACGLGSDALAAVRAELVERVEVRLERAKSLRPR